MRYAYTACDCLIRTCYAPNQLANLAVVQVGHISCAVINVPLGPDTWPRPRTLEPASWALCLTFWRPCWWWHRQLHAHRGSGIDGADLASQVSRVQLLGSECGFGTKVTAQRHYPSPLSQQCSWFDTEVPHELRDQGTVWSEQPHWVMAFSSSLPVNICGGVHVSLGVD